MGRLFFAEPLKYKKSDINSIKKNIHIYYHRKLLNFANQKTIYINSSINHLKLLFLHPAIVIFTHRRMIAFPQIWICGKSEI